MNIDDYFQFHDDLEGVCLSAGFCATLPAGVATREELIAVLKEILLFPAYCGSNWDAIDECMGDFSWIEQYKICILHPVIPDVPAKALKIYLEILYYRVESWRNEGGHELIVIFNSKDSVRVKSALS